MRIIVFFDLPIITDSEKNEYRKFRNFLVKNGFIMVQKSVYAKLALNNSVVESVKTSVKANLPKDGLVQMLTITEKQFGSIDYLIGHRQTTYIDSDKRLVEL